MRTGENTLRQPPFYEFLVIFFDGDSMEIVWMFYGDCFCFMVFVGWLVTHDISRRVLGIRRIPSVIFHHFSHNWYAHPPENAMSRGIDPYGHGSSCG